MPSIPGFWDEGPHDPLPIEESWRSFVRSGGGSVLDDLLPEPRTFENADFLFSGANVVIELKEVETEFSSQPRFRHDFDALVSRVVSGDPGWRPVHFGGSDKYPAWFTREFVRLFRPAISRILKKANRQLRETKAHFSIGSPTGVLLFANDGFTSLGPDLIRALAASLLQNSYSSIDCFVYLTVNRYVEISGSPTPRLVWAPTYSDRASEELVDFIDLLGRNWFDHLEQLIGPFTERGVVSQDANVLWGAKAITIPGKA